MIKTLLTATALAAVMASASNAATANLDFVALAAGTPGDRGGVEGQTFDFGGLGVTLSSTADAYLDDLSSGKPGGLGVCSSGLTGTAQCVDAGDDNISLRERVTLSFDLPVLRLTNFVFYDFEHNPINLADELGAEFEDVFGILGGTATFGNLENAILVNQRGALSSLTLSSIGTQFYLGSVTAEFEPAAVPLPASIFLLGGALGGMGVMRRRRKAA